MRCLPMGNPRSSHLGCEDAYDRRWHKGRTCTTQTDRRGTNSEGSRESAASIWRRRRTYERHAIHQVARGGGGTGFATRRCKRMLTNRRRASICDRSLTAILAASARHFLIEHSLNLAQSERPVPMGNGGCALRAKGRAGNSCPREEPQCVAAPQGCQRTSPPGCTADKAFDSQQPHLPTMRPRLLCNVIRISVRSDQNRTSAWPPRRRAGALANAGTGAWSQKYASRFDATFSRYNLSGRPRRWYEAMVFVAFSYLWTLAKLFHCPLF